MYLCAGLMLCKFVRKRAPVNYPLDFGKTLSCPSCSSYTAVTLTTRSSEKKGQIFDKLFVMKSMNGGLHVHPVYYFLTCLLVTAI